MANDNSTLLDEAATVADAPIGKWVRAYSEPRSLLQTGISLWVVMPLAMALLAGLLAASTYRHFEATWDEPEHLAAGLQLLDRGIYTYDVQHPPLARVAIALGPYLAGARSHGEPGPGGVQEGRDILYQGDRYEQLLARARLGVLPFLFLLLGSTWLWTKRYFGAPEAAIAVGLLASCPPLIGHAALATLDVPGAAMCALALYGLLRWLETLSLRHALAAGLASGLAIGTKLSAVPFIALAASAWLLAWSISTPRDLLLQSVRSRRVWLGALILPTMAVAAAVLCYGLRFTYLVDAAHPDNAALDWIAAGHASIHDLLYAMAQRIPVPVGLAELPHSIQVLVWHNNGGHLSYLLGRTSQTGWRSFYLVALAVKTPLPLLVLGVAGLGLLAWRARLPESELRLNGRGWMQSAPAIAFVVLLAFCSLYSHINIGVRHVFILYPMMAIAAAVATIRLWRQWKHPALRAAIGALLFWQASTLWTAYPDYLAYFNEAAGSQPERILIDSDLDWGQDLERLKTRLRQLHVTSFSFIYQGSADIGAQGLPPVQLLPGHVPASGWVAASLYARRVNVDGSAYAWLDRYQPLERVGKSIDLFFIPPPAGPGKQAIPTGPPAACGRGVCPAPATLQ